MISSPVPEGRTKISVTPAPTFGRADAAAAGAFMPGMPIGFASAAGFAVPKSPRFGSISAFKAVEHAQLVALGLQAAEEPRPDVGQRLVVEIHRVLRR